MNVLFTPETKEHLRGFMRNVKDYLEENKEKCDICIDEKYNSNNSNSLEPNLVKEVWFKYKNIIIKIQNIRNEFDYYQISFVTTENDVLFDYSRDVPLINSVSDLAFKYIQKRVDNENSEDNVNANNKIIKVLVENIGFI